MRLPLWPRYLGLAFAGISLISGLTAGLRRLGVLGEHGVSAMAHGPFMVFGFIGGAIVLERAVAMRQWWSMTACLAGAIGVITTLLGLPSLVPGIAWVAAGIILCVIYAVGYRRQASFAVVTQAAGALAFTIAALLWALTGDFARAVPLAMLFAGATIIGERLELARITIADTIAEPLLCYLTLAAVGAGIMSIVLPGPGRIGLGVILMVLACTAARVDIARRLIHGNGLPRFSATCMMVAYVWLLFAGLGLILSPVLVQNLYDAWVHAFFLGFVMSMIVAHAPIILSGVLGHGRRLPYHPIMYVPLGIIGLSLLLRVLSDLLELISLYHFSGILGVVGIAAFVLLSVFRTVTASRQKKAS